LIIKEVLQTFLFNETLPAFMGIMFMGGILWRRANRHGAAASIITAFVVYYLVNHQHSGKWHLVAPGDDRAVLSLKSIFHD
jgi:Na+/proline symporter